MEEVGSPLLEMRGIGKRFPGVTALDRVSLLLHRGEVLALAGENGAGKSTLMKVLGGAHQPDEGTIEILGAPQRFASVADSKEAGIAIIHQELMLAPNLDIAGNVFLGGEARPLGLVSPLRRRRMEKAADDLLRRVGLAHSARTPVARLTIGERQMVEIAKALAQNARILVMDEPTSSLTLSESARLFEIVRALRDEGIAIVYISHRMDELLSLADRLMVLRDGRNVGELSRADATRDRIVQMMVGRDLQQSEARRPPASTRDEAFLVVEDLLVPGARTPVSFTAARGEILGFAGLVGSGRTELMQTLFGATPALGGSVRLAGETFLPARPREAISRGICLAPEDRKRHGLVLPLSIARNTTLPSIHAHSRFGFLDSRRERRVAAEEVARFRVKTHSIEKRAGDLSGGNQQKVVLGKWLATKPRVLILDEPTRGIDVGAKAEIYRHMSALADEGMTILMVSSDMEEVLEMSDRVVVMHERRIRGILPRGEATEMKLARLMTGEASEGTRA